MHSLTELNERRPETTRERAASTWETGASTREPGVSTQKPATSNLESTVGTQEIRRSPVPVPGSLQAVPRSVVP